MIPRHSFAAALASLFILSATLTLSGQTLADPRAQIVARPWSCWTAARATQAVFGTVVSDGACDAFPAQAASIHLTAVEHATPIAAPAAPTALVASVASRTMVLT